MTQHSQDFPWFPDKANLDPITGLEEAPEERPVPWDTAFMAGFSRGSVLSPGFERVIQKDEPFIEPVYPPVEGYNPIDDPSIKDRDKTPFVGSQSPQETKQLIGKVERDTRLDKEATGVSGVAGEVFAFVSNPLLLAGAALTGGMSIAPTIATLAATEGINESIRHSQKPLLTKTESAINVAGVAALTGVGHLVFGRARPKIAADLNMSPTPLTPAQGDAGAALAKEVVDLTEEVSVPRSGLVRALGETLKSPASDVVVNSASNEAKQLVREMVDVNIRVEGKATTSAESMAQEVDGKLFSMTRDFELQYKDYMDKGGKLDDVEFLELVGDAMRNGDDFPSIPQVQSVARAYRKIKDDYKSSKRRFVR